MLTLIIFQVNNTDAEGRLTLADALVYACNQGVEKVFSKYILRMYLHISEQINWCILCLKLDLSKSL